MGLWLKVGALTSTWQVGVPPAEAQGRWMLHMAFSYKAKILHTSARFPMLEHTGKNANVLSSFSLKGSSQASGLKSEEKLSVFRVG